MTIPDGRSPYIDWSVVTDEHVEAALRSLLTVERMAARWDGITDEVRDLHLLVLRGYITTGGAPSSESLARSMVLDRARIQSMLLDLEHRDLILLNDSDIDGAYPFSSNPSRHQVVIDGRAIPTICAIDALGTAAMIGQPVWVNSTCPVCEASIGVAVGDDGLSIHSMSPNSTVVWAAVTETNGCAADTQCKSMLAFCSDQHLDDWRGSSQDGFRLTPAQATKAGAAIFRPFLAPNLSK